MQQKRQFPEIQNVNQTVAFYVLLSNLPKMIVRHFSMPAYRFIVDCFKVFTCELNGIIHSKEVLMSCKQFNICKQLSTTR